MITILCGDYFLILPNGLHQWENLTAIQEVTKLREPSSRMSSIVKSHDQPYEQPNVYLFRSNIKDIITYEYTLKFLLNPSKIDYPKSTKNSSSIWTSQIDKLNETITNNAFQFHIQDISKFMSQSLTLNIEGYSSICVQNDPILLYGGVVGKGNIMIGINMENEDINLFVFKKRSRKGERSYKSPIIW